MTHSNKDVLDQFCITEMLDSRFLLYYRNNGDLVAIEDLVLGTFEVINEEFIIYYMK